MTEKQYIDRLPTYEEWRTEFEKNNPVTLFKWHRHFKISVRTLLAAAKSPKNLKLYCFYLNIHSLYRQKVILNYKSKYQIIAKKCNVTDRILRTFIKELIKNKICWEDKGALWIGTPEKFARYLNILDNFYYNEYRFYNTKFIRLERKEHLTRQELERLTLKLGIAKKEFSILKKGISDFTRKKAKSKLLQKEAKVKEYLAEKSGDELHLYLNDIKNLFNLNSIQAASYKLKTLQGDNLKVHKQFKYIRKVKLPDKRISNKLFIKNGWLIEQLPNRLEFIDDFCIKNNFWSKVISEYHKIITTLKGYKIKSKSKVSYRNLAHSLFNKRALKESKRMFKRLYISKETGEVLHEHIFYKVKDLLITGWKETIKHITSFKEINEEYTVIEQAITGS